MERTDPCVLKVGVKKDSDITKVLNRYVFYVYVYNSDATMTALVQILAFLSTEARGIYLKDY